MPFRHPLELRARAVTLVREGRRPVDVAALLGVSWTAVYAWLHDEAPELVGRSEHCFRCGDEGPPPDGRAYAHLLGLYLGDGWLVRHPRSWSMNIACADAYPGLRDEARASVSAVSGGRTGLVQRRGCCDVRAYWRHWPCAFPQHGPGKKHHRNVHLDEWQWDVVVQHPGSLVRGLFHSDGWRGRNVAVRSVDGVRQQRHYVRYEFSNRSDDIRHLCGAGLDLLGIAWRPVGRWRIAVSRRGAVEALDRHVGPKH